MERAADRGFGGSLLGPAVRSAAGLRYEGVRVLLSLPDPVLHLRLHASGYTHLSLCIQGQPPLLRPLSLRADGCMHSWERPLGCGRRRLGRSSGGGSRGGAGVALGARARAGRTAAPPST